MKKRLLVVPVALALVLLFATSSIALAGDPFLCPVVGDGVKNADSHNGDNGVSVIEPPVGTSQLPGKNQAGAHANDNAHNTDGPGNPDAGPGGNPDYSPIWPG